MASKVNVKFVVILSISLVVFAAIVGAAGFMLVFKSGAEHARIGDKLAAQGEWDQARRAYAKAVNKEPTTPEYLEKWADAIGHVAPVSETEYRDLLLNDLNSAYSQLAAVQPTNLEAQKRVLDFGLTQFEIATPTPERAIGLVDRATGLIERFESSPPDDNAWMTLYRYRGLPLASSMNANNPIEEPMRTQAREDLERALVGDPNDERSQVALAWWYAATANDQQDAGKVEDAIASLKTAIEGLDAFIATHPDASRAMLERTIRVNQADIMAASRGLLGDDARAVQRERQHDMAPSLPGIMDVMLAAPVEKIDPNALLMFSRVENVADPESKMAMSARIADQWCQKLPTDAKMLLSAADVDERRGEFDSALARYDTLATLKTLPVSVEGYLQLNLRREAMYNRARLRLDELLRDPNAANFDAKLTQGKANRQEFAQQVSDEDARLLMLDGMIAQVNQDLTAAREFYRRYNEQTLTNDPMGLWRQTQTALQLNFTTEAVTLLKRMLELQPSNRTATLALAEVYYQQQMKEESLRLFTSMLRSDPDNQGIKDRIAQLNAMLNPTAAGNDPVLAARAQAQTLRNGTQEVSGDLNAAAEFLEEKVKELNYPESLTVDLIQNYLDLARVEDARATAAAAVAANPSSERFARFNTALQAGSVTETLIALIDQSERTDIEKAITRYRVYLTQGDSKAAAAQLDEAVKLDPEYPSLVEIRFDNAIGNNDTALAEQMAATAAKLNLDKADGSLFRARLLSTKGNHAEATALLERTIASGKTFPMAFRLLAGEQAIQGHYDDAIETLERTLALNQNDPPTQLQYIRLLVAAGRSNDALIFARTCQASGQAPKYITDSWLESEALSGGDEGRAAAIVRRESIRSLQPGDKQNNAALAELYILTRQFAKAKPLIDELKRDESTLPVVMLEMRWNADQGRLIVDGTPVDGLVAAQRLFQDFLLDQDESALTPEVFLSYARFMNARNQVDLALPAIEKARELETDGAMDAEKMLGDLYYMRGRFSEAAEVFTALLNADADTEDQVYRKRLVESLIRVSRYQEALATLEKMETTDLTTLLQRAEILFGLDRAGEARGVLDQAVQKYPTNPLVYVRRAEANVGNEALSGDVQADIQAALRIEPGNWRALRLRGVIAWEQGRRAQAIADIRAAVASNPQLEQLLFGLMNELITAGEDGQAADIADDTIAARPTDAQLMLNCARVFANHDVWDRATEYTRKAWEQSKDPQVGVLLVDSLVRLSPPRVNEAEGVYNELVRLIPDAAQSMLMLATEATVRHAQGRDNSTIRALTQALTQIQDNPGDVLSWAQHVQRVYRSSPADAGKAMTQIAGDPVVQLSDLVRGWLTLVTAQQLATESSTVPQAVKLLRGLRDRPDTDPLSTLAFRIEGATLYKDKDYESASAVWGEGLARFPDDWEMLNNQAYLLAKELNRASDALPLAERAMQLDSTQLSSYDTLALIYTKLGRFDDAAKTLVDASALATSTAQQVTLNIAKIRLHLAKGETESARKLSTDTRGMIFGTVGLSEMAETLDELDGQISSASP